MAQESPSEFICPLCAKSKPKASAVQGEMVHGPTMELIRRDHAQLAAGAALCRDCLNDYRARYVETVLRQDRGELSTLDAEVVRSLREHEILSQNLNQEFEQVQTMGERVADRVATFGGSWRFIIIFLSVLLVWIAINSIVLLRRPFDPYPFILLNLVLSCVAAIQAPVIMMSQNRQEAKDRLRAEHDYQVNLKAELEIRHLQSKMDQLLSRQWQRLLEIQEIQTDLLSELTRKEKGEERNR